MCLIIANTTGERVPTEYIINAYSQNSDGFGIMYSKLGLLRVKRGLFTIANILDIFEGLADAQIPYVAHFRYATHGTMNSANCHPFPISTKQGGIAMAHNGTLLGTEWVSSKRSDTAILAGKITRHLEKKHIAPTNLFEKDIPFIEEHYGKAVGYDKLVFMNGKGEINIFNEDCGLWMEGVWYSNLYSLCSTKDRYSSWLRGAWTSADTATKAPVEAPAKPKIAAE
jgi:hypothetical protein